MAESSSKHPVESDISLASIMASILDDCLYNIVADTVLQVHREEKVRRMKSAAVLAEIAQEQENPSLQNTADNSSLQAVKNTSPILPPAPTTTTVTPAASITPEGKIYLSRNPLLTVPSTSLHCAACRLPTLLHPTTGARAQIPNPSITYCARQPPISKSGCDIHGRSLELQKPSKKSKAVLAREAAARRTSLHETFGSQTGDDDPNSQGQDEPAATSIPSGKCPECQRHMAYTRIAQHMERCMKIGVRTGPKRATGSVNTPVDGSRQGTPKPSGIGSSGLGSGAAASAAADLLKKNMKRKLGAVDKASFEDEEDYGEASEGDDGFKARTNGKEDKGVKKKKLKVKGAGGAADGGTSVAKKADKAVDKDKGKGAVGGKRPPAGKRPPGQLVEGVGNGGGGVRARGEEKG